MTFLPSRRRAPPRLRAANSRRLRLAKSVEQHHMYEPANARPLAEPLDQDRGSIPIAFTSDGGPGSSASYLARFRTLTVVSVGLTLLAISRLATSATARARQRYLWGNVMSGPGAAPHPDSASNAAPTRSVGRIRALFRRASGQPHARGGGERGPILHEGLRLGPERGEPV